MKKRKEVVDNISLLYELALAIGSSLNMEENCACFIDKLILKTNSISASVWLRNNVFNQDDFFNYLLVYSNPSNSLESIMIDKKRLWDLGLFQLDNISSGSNYFFLPSTEQIQEDDNNQYVIFNLRENGFIRICFPQNIGKRVLIPKLNAFKDHGWDGFYNKQERLQRFPAMVYAPRGAVYGITYTGSPAKKQNYKLMS